MSQHYFVRERHGPRSEPGDTRYEVCEHLFDPFANTRPDPGVIREFHAEVRYQAPTQGGYEPRWEVRKRTEAFCERLNAGGATRERALREAKS